MHPNEELIHKFYSAFQKLDWQTMTDCYAPDAEFSDPVFRDLKGWQIGAMWRMLAERAQNFTLEYRDIKADDRSGSAYWEPAYDFSKTGRRIVNKIRASFEFRDGKIVKHTDQFDFYRWVRLALGFKGALLGWLPSIQNQVRKEALTGYEMFVKRKRLGPAS